MNLSSTLCAALEKSYADRTVNRSAFPRTWKECTKAFPPSLKPLYAVHEFPSFQLAHNAGDLGLATLWIVQTVLIRSFITEINVRGHAAPAGLNTIHPETISSLAHSEDSSNPVTVQEEREHIIINGFKKYITGGLHSNFILLTARRPGEEKISKLIHIPASMLPEGALQDLILGTLETTSHASLTLNQLQLPKNYLIPLKPEAIRKILKVQGILERSLIIQSYLGLLMYISEKTDGVPEHIYLLIKSLLNDHNRLLEAQIAAARDGAMVSPVSTDLREIPSMIDTLKKINAGHTGEIDSTLLPRFRDLDFFSRSGA